MQHIVRRGYTAVSLNELLDGNRREAAGDSKRVLITFDDGYLDNFTNAFPVLKELGLPAVIFLVADFSRRTNWWDTPLGVPEARLLEPNHIAEMAGGGIDFGSHTLTHRSLPSLDDDELREELEGSRAAVERVTGKQVRAFSYPYSHLDTRVKSALQAAGYECGFAVNGGPYHSTDDRLEIRRVNVTSSAHGLRFAAKLSGVEKLGLWTWWKARQLTGGRTAFEIRRGF
jgi:peptidoglycan/xylan/chitin deacetylase (PgdA/CDA1 family)